MIKNFHSVTKLSGRCWLPHCDWPVSHGRNCGNISGPHQRVYCRKRSIDVLELCRLIKERQLSPRRRGQFCTQLLNSYIFTSGWDFSMKIPPLDPQHQVCLLSVYLLAFWKHFCGIWSKFLSRSENCLWIYYVCLKFYMSPSFTACNIAIASRLFFIFTPLYSPLKILFSHQVLAQYREKQESYKENIILSGRVTDNTTFQTGSEMFDALLWGKRVT